MLLFKASPSIQGLCCYHFCPFPTSLVSPPILLFLRVYIYIYYLTHFFFFFYKISPSLQQNTSKVISIQYLQILFSLQPIPIQHLFLLLHWNSSDTLNGSLLNPHFIWSFSKIGLSYFLLLDAHSDRLPELSFGLPPSLLFAHFSSSFSGLLSFELFQTSGSVLPVHAHPSLPSFH